MLFKKLALLVLIACSATLALLIISFDAYEWFYKHSRRYEAYQYDDLVLCLFLFLTIGIIWLGIYFYQKASTKIRYIGDGESDQPLEQLGLLECIRKMSRPLPNSYQSPLLLLFSLLLIIAAAEALDMIVLEQLPPLSKYTLALIDALFLVLIISPALYFIFLRPLLNQIIIRERFEKSLVQLNRQLEERIESRTTQLQKELDERRITEQRLVEHQKQLRSLSSQLSIAEEKEKLRIATDLHDNIGHALAMTNNRLELLRGSLPSDKEKEFLDEIQVLVIKAIRYTRSLGTELSTPLINHLPFVSAVEWLAEDILGTNGIAFSLKIEGSPQLAGSDSRIIFIKAIKEIMINIVKHAKAKNVEIIIGKKNDDIIVKINDDGMGFDADSLSPVIFEDWSGFGIFTIRERITDLKGHFQIVSESGRGTDVTLSIPCTNSEAAEET